MKNKKSAMLGAFIGYVGIIVTITLMILMGCTTDQKRILEVTDTDTLEDVFIYTDSIDNIDVVTVDTLEVNYNFDTIKVIATMYHPVAAQCDANPNKTADQTLIPDVNNCSDLNWIAVSQDLLWFNGGPIHYGDSVYVIAGHKEGWFIVRDAMNSRWKNRVDFLESIGVEAYRYKNAEIYINS